MYKYQRYTAQCFFLWWLKWHFICGSSHKAIGITSLMGWKSKTYNTTTWTVTNNHWNILNVGRTVRWAPSHRDMLLTSMECSHHLKLYLVHLISSPRLWSRDTCTETQVKYIARAEYAPESNREGLRSRAYALNQNMTHCFSRGWVLC